ncbi:hypothetical protein NHG29_01390 [Aerococcaceae bacterium NML160702]|nr:hypothetical protein [Aerococcaceae bacterium NML190073]MCW6681520.1 hypothetical protein [Aerococcaceae bacterium NML160702]
MMNWIRLVEIRGDGSKGEILINLNHIVDIKERINSEGKKVTIILYSNGESVPVEEPMHVVRFKMSDVR